MPASRTNVTPAANVRLSTKAVSSTRRDMGVRRSSRVSKLDRPVWTWQSKMPGNSHSPSPSRVTWLHDGGNVPPYSGDDPAVTRTSTGPANPPLSSSTFAPRMNMDVVSVPSTRRP